MFCTFPYSIIYDEFVKEDGVFSIINNEWIVQQVVLGPLSRRPYFRLRPANSVEFIPRPVIPPGPAPVHFPAYYLRHVPQDLVPHVMAIDIVYVILEPGGIKGHMPFPDFRVVPVLLELLPVQQIPEFASNRSPGFLNRPLICGPTHVIRGPLLQFPLNCVS